MTYSVLVADLTGRSCTEGVVFWAMLVSTSFSLEAMGWVGSPDSLGEWHVALQVVLAGST